MKSRISSFGEVNFAAAELGDARRTQRLIRTADLMSRRPGGTLPQKLRTPADLRAFYRLVNCEEVTHEAILAPHREARGVLQYRLQLLLYHQQLQRIKHLLQLGHHRCPPLAAIGLQTVLGCRSADQSQAANTGNERFCGQAGVVDQVRYDEVSERGERFRLADRQGTIRVLQDLLQSLPGPLFQMQGHLATAHGE